MVLCGGYVLTSMFLLVLLYGVVLLEMVYSFLLRNSGYVLDLRGFSSSFFLFLLSVFHLACSLFIGLWFISLRYSFLFCLTFLIIGVVMYLFWIWFYYWVLVLVWIFLEVVFCFLVGYVIVVIF